MNSVSGSTILPDWTGKVFAVQFSPDGNLLFRGSRPRTVQLWYIDKERTQERYSLAGPMRPSCLAFSPDGTTLATGSEKGVVKLWEAGHLVNSGGREGATLFGHGRRR